MSEALPLASGAGAAAVVERLAARQQQLAAEREQRQAQLQAEADSREDVDGFLSAYKSDYTQLQQRSSDMKAQASTTQQDGAAKAALLDQLEALSLEVSNKEHSVSEASYFLPSYELRSCTTQLQQLRLQLADIKQQLQPKRKFAFSKAVARTNISATAAAAASTAQLQQGTNLPLPAAAPSTASSLLTASGVDTHASTDPPAPSPQDQQLIAAGHGYAGRTGQLLVPSAQQLAGQGFVLHSLTDCDVFLLGQLSALRLQLLHNCRVYTGPVVGATFVDSCRGCVFMLASYQVRIHSAEACSFYLRVRSRPIIEHSSSLTFAPYPVEALLHSHASTTAQDSMQEGQHSHASTTAQDSMQEGQRSQQQQQPEHASTTVQDGMQEGQRSQQQQQPEHASTTAQDSMQEGQHSQQQQPEQEAADGMVQAAASWCPQQLLAAAQLADDSRFWQQVDDFGWVKASASPHWRVLPEAERQQPPEALPCKRGQQPA